MSIIDSDSILIVGAGCSSQFGLPMGGQLLNMLHDQLQQAQQIIRDKNFSNGGVNYYALQVSGFMKAPVFAALLKRYCFDGHVFLAANFQNLLDRMVELEKRLSGQTSETIDDFLVENREFREEVKIGIAAVLLRSMYQQQGNQNWAIIRDLEARSFQIKSSGAPTFIIERNWIHYLINLVRQGVKRGAVSRENKVKIISFNYDGILEFVLAEQFSNTGGGYPHFSEFFEIVHPHGFMGKPPKKVQNCADLALEWASEIYVVQEGEDDDPIVNDAVVYARQVAANWVANAGKIYSVGFAFAYTNCELLGLNTNKIFGSGVNPLKRLVYCNYDGNVGLRNSVNLIFGALTERERKQLLMEAHGEREEGALKISATDFLRSGYLGQLP